MIKQGEIIKTIFSDNTLVLETDNKNCVLFAEGLFIVPEKMKFNENNKIYDWNNQFFTTSMEEANNYFKNLNKNNVKEEKMDFQKDIDNIYKNIKGNVVGEVEVKDIKTKEGETIKAANFSVAINKLNQEVKFINCSAYG